MEQIIFAGPRTRKSGLSPKVFLPYVLDGPFSSTGQENSFVHYVLSLRSEYRKPPPTKKQKVKPPPGLRLRAKLLGRNGRRPRRRWRTGHDGRHTCNYERRAA